MKPSRLILRLAQLASETYLEALRIKHAVVDAADADSAFDEAADDGDDETVLCQSMEEARAVVIAGRQEGDEVLIHEQGCSARDGFECDCDAVPFTVGEKVEA